MGLVVGAVGGASVQAASSASSQVSSEVSKAVTRVTVQGASAAATDAGIQFYQTGKIDYKQTALMTAGQLVVAGTAEASSAKAQRTSAYAEKVNDQLIEENVAKDKITKGDAQEIKDKFKKINSMKEDIKPGIKNSDAGNAHVLEDRANSKRGGQIALDFGSKGEEGNRGAGRVIGEKINGKIIYVDHTADHDYKGCRETIKGQLKNPIEGLKVVKIDSVLEFNEEAEDDEILSEKKKIE